MKSEHSSYFIWAVEGYNSQNEIENSKIHEHEIWQNPVQTMDYQAQNSERKEDETNQEQLSKF